VQDRKEKTSFFNWFYFFVNIGSLIAVTVIVWIQENVGWAVGFAIPAAAMGLAIVTFVSGSRRYKHVPPTERSAGGGAEMFSLSLYWSLRRGLLRAAACDWQLSYLWALMPSHLPSNASPVQPLLPSLQRGVDGVQGAAAPPGRRAGRGR